MEQTSEHLKSSQISPVAQPLAMPNNGFQSNKILIFEFSPDSLFPGNSFCQIMTEIKKLMEEMKPLIGKYEHDLKEKKKTSWLPKSGGQSLKVSWQQTTLETLPLWLSMAL